MPPLSLLPTNHSTPLQLPVHVAYIQPMIAATRSDSNFKKIRDDFSLLEDWEDRYRYLIDLGGELEPLPDMERNDRNKVRGCASQVWLWTQHRDDDSLHFVGDSDAHIVRGLVAVVIALFSDLSPEEIQDIDTDGKLAELDISEHLSAQRSNGLRSMIKRIKAEARASLTEAD